MTVHIDMSAYINKPRYKEQSPEPKRLLNKEQGDFDSANEEALAAFQDTMYPLRYGEPRVPKMPDSAVSEFVKLNPGYDIEPIWNEMVNPKSPEGSLLVLPEF